MAVSPHAKINWKWIKDLNARPEPISCTEENAGPELADGGWTPRSCWYRTDLLAEALAAAAAGSAGSGSAMRMRTARPTQRRSALACAGLRPTLPCAAACPAPPRARQAAAQVQQAAPHHAGACSHNSEVA